MNARKWVTGQVTTFGWWTTWHRKLQLIPKWTYQWTEIWTETPKTILEHPTYPARVQNEAIYKDLKTDGLEGGWIKEDRKHMV
jgi:hypothetical protein